MKEIVEAYNALAFITPRSLSSVTTVEELSLEVQNDYLEVFNYLLMKFGKSKHYLKDLNKSFANNDSLFQIKEVFPGELMIKSYMEILQATELTNIAFTPLLSAHEDESIGGLNCLAKTIVLGALIKKLGHTVKLALSIDHAAVLIVRPEGNYYCRIDRMSFTLLRGIYQQHDLYQWYIVDPADCLIFNYLVVQDFEIGILNGICENFAFMSRIDEIELDAYEKRMRAIAKEEYPFKKLFSGINWLQLQRSYFGHMDEYRQRYEIEFLLECEAIKEERTTIVRCVKGLDDAVAVAYEVATGEKVKGDNLFIFFQEWGKLIYDAFKSLARGLSLNQAEFEITVTKDLQTFIKALHVELKKDLIVRKYFMLKTLGAIDSVE